MDLDETSQNATLSFTPSLSLYLSEIEPIDPLENFLSILKDADMSQSSLEELDQLLGFSLYRDPMQVYFRYDHQYDPHLFLRMCFFLVGKSLAGLQAWADIYRFGFFCNLHWYPNDVLDVSVNRHLQDYSISVQVHLKDASRVFDAPAWLSSTSLSAQPPSPFGSFCDVKPETWPSQSNSSSEIVSKMLYLQDLTHNDNTSMARNKDSAAATAHSNTDTRSSTSNSTHPQATVSGIPAHLNSESDQGAPGIQAQVLTKLPFTTTSVAPASFHSVAPDCAGNDNRESLSRTPTLLNEVPSSDTRDAHGSSDTVARVPTLQSATPSTPGATSESTPGTLTAMVGQRSSINGLRNSNRRRSIVFESNAATSVKTECDRPDSEMDTSSSALNNS